MKKNFGKFIFKKIYNQDKVDLFDLIDLGVVDWVDMID